MFLQYWTDRDHRRPQQNRRPILQQVKEAAFSLKPPRLGVAHVRGDRLQTLNAMSPADLKALFAGKGRFQEISNLVDILEQVKGRTGKGWICNLKQGEY